MGVPAITQLRRDILAAVLLAVFPLAVIVCYKIALSSFRMIAADGLSFIAPLLEDGCRQIMNGNIPWWSHHTLCGFPILGRGCGSLYPPHLLVFAVKSILGITTPAFFISIVLHISLCAVSSYGYLRYIGCRMGCAAVGALGFSMAGSAFGFGCNWPRDYSIPFAYLPLAFLFIEESLIHRPSLALISLGGFIGGNILLMAHPQMAFKLLLVCGIYLGLRYHRRQHGAVLITCLLALAVALLIGSVQIAATYELLEHSLRVTSGGIGGSARTAYSLRPVFFLGVVYPYIQFDWPNEDFARFPGGALFVGPLAVLALISCLYYWRRSSLPIGTFLVLAALYFILCLGKYFPGEPYLGSLPLFENFRYPIRWSAEFCGIAALISGVGLELLLKHKNTRSAQFIFGAFFVGLALVMIVSFSQVFGMDVKWYYFLICFCWYCGAAILWFLMRRYSARYFIYGAVLFTAAGMTANIPIAKIISPAGLKVLWHRPLTIGRDSMERVLFLGTIEDMVAGEGNYAFNMPHYFGSRSVLGYDSLTMTAQKKWKNGIGMTGENIPQYYQVAINNFLKSHLIETLRVGWVIVPRSETLLVDACVSKPELDEIDGGKWMSVFRNRGFREPAFFINGLTYDTKLESGTKMGELKLNTHAWIEPGYREQMDFKDAGTNRVSGFIEEHGNISFNVKAENKGFVVVTSTWYPGWEVYIDGVRSPLFRVNSSFIGLPVPAGDHSIELKYEPRLIRLLLYLGIFTYMVVVIIMGFWLFRFKKHPDRDFRQ